MSAGPARTALVLAALSGVAGSVAIAQDEGVDPAPPTSQATAAADEGGAPPGAASIRWARASGRDCHRYHGRRVCEGPRRVPMPGPEALRRQQALGLDHPRTAHRATTGPPPPEWVAAIPTGDAPRDLLWPVPGGRLWRGYGMHRRLGRTKAGKLRRLRGRRRHEGVDIGAAEGTPIVAANDGLVVYSDNGMSGYGNAVILVHRDASVTLYAHCSATYVAAGDLVARGQVIAAVGATGLAHGAHLHFEWRIAGRSRDPLDHFVERPPREGSSGGAVPPADEQTVADRQPDFTEAAQEQ